jgi:membrane-bound serine protease (ClpP class)
MDPQLIAILLMLAGIALIFAELFVPSGGTIALMCLGCFAASGYYAYQAWFHSAPVYWWSYLATVAVVIPASLVAAFQLLTRTSLGNRMLLAAPTPEEIIPYQAEQDRLTALIGREGTAINLMTPGGLVNLDGERLHAIADGLMVEPGTQVKIVAVRGTRVVVVPVSVASAADQNQPFAPEAEQALEEMDPWSRQEDPPA